MRIIGRLGYGAMRLATEPTADRNGSIAVLRRAVELGVTLIDTAHMYGWGANEELIAAALHPYPESLLVATKVGVSRPDGEWALDGRPEALRAGVEQGLRRLRVERLDLLQLHRIDPEVPLADQLGVLRELQEAGLIGHIGLSEVTVDELAAARRIVEVASVQNRYNVLDREHDAVLDACTDAGIAYLPWRPVAVSGDTTELTAVAAELDATEAQVCLAWLLARSPVMVPIPGTASIAHLQENVAATGLTLSDDQRRRLDGVPSRE